MWAPLVGIKPSAALCSAPFGNSRSAGAVGQGTVAKTLLECDTRRRKLKQSRGKESRRREVFIPRYEREGRKRKIKKSSKGMSALKGCATYAAYPHVLIHTEKEKKKVQLSQ